LSKKDKILIVEDDVLIAEFIHENLLCDGYTIIDIAHDCKTAEEKFSTFYPDIILMDINIDGSNLGIELSKKRNLNSRLIYITAQNDMETIEKAIETSPDGYLTKPVKKLDVLAAVSLASSKRKKEFIIVKDGFKQVKILFNELLYVKSDGNYIDVQTKSKKITLRQSLDGFLLELDTDHFLKVHRSYIVNKHKITSKASSSIFIDLIEIPISRTCNFDL